MGCRVGNGVGDVEEVTFLYRLTPGACPKCYGVNVALLAGGRNMKTKQVKPFRAYLRWPHMQADEVCGLSLREFGGGFTKHHRAPSIRSACYAIAKLSTLVQRMQNKMKLMLRKLVISMFGLS
ncbi:uncharacterized protein LOC142633560 isoform X1 [Castanea sativa]|uniref:uncharacterized protein LOC142633560 isoform X1 n=1 Tax=Castanea sativa TaxID=21020 RepID=UPI003F650F4A